MNKCFFKGNMTADPELKNTPNGASVINFSIGVNSGWGDKKTTVFPRLVIWNKGAENLAKLTQKGTKLWIEGELTQRSWDKEGENRRVEEYRVLNFEVLDGFKKKEGALPHNNEMLSTNYDLDSEDSEIPF